MPLHARNLASVAPPPAVQDRAPASTGPACRVSDQRREGRRLASQLLTSSGIPLAQVARELDVSASRAAQWGDPEADASIALGDVLALRHGDRLLRAALAVHEARQSDASIPEAVRVLSLVAQAGELVAEGARAAADGRIDDSERRALRHRLDGLEDALAAVRRAIGVQE